MNLVQPTNQSELNPKDAEFERKDLVRDGSIHETGDSQEIIIKQYVKKEQREAHTQETEQFQEELHQTLRKPPKGVGDDQRIKDTPEPLSVKSEFLLELENMLADGLGDLYNDMEPDLQVQFKNKGEVVARRIEQIVAQGKLKVKKILNLIKSWLKMIPGVSKFFLEQEAKIKTDKIISMSL